MINNYLCLRYNREIESITEGHNDTRAWSTSGNDVYIRFSLSVKKPTRINITSGLRHRCGTEIVLIPSRGINTDYGIQPHDIYL